MSTHHIGTRTEDIALDAFILFFRACGTISSKLIMEIQSYNITEPQFNLRSSRWESIIAL